MSMGIRIVKISQSMYCMLRARSISATFLKEANVHLVFKVETWNFDKIIYSSQNLRAGYRRQRSMLFTFLFYLKGHSTQNESGI